MRYEHATIHDLVQICCIARTTYLLQDTRGDVRKRNRLVALANICKWVIAISTKTRGAHDPDDETHPQACS